MKNIDYTFIASIITALAAIIAPTITALIHSIKEYQIAKLNNTLKERLNLCERFSDAYSRCQYGEHGRVYALSFYKETLKLIALCHHRSVRRSLFVLANEVLNHEVTKDTDKLYEKCILLLTKEF